MIEYNKSQIGKRAKESGFIRDTYEKVLRLKEVLVFINSNKYLNSHLALKGGTAINLTIFDLPRLSVDIDLDFTPNTSRTEMQEHRNEITESIKNHMIGEGYQLDASSRYSYSLDAMMFVYMNSGGNRDNIKIEINYSLRAHIFEPITKKITSDIFNQEIAIRTLVPLETFAAKINALMNRTAIRDLYDVNNAISLNLFDKEQYEILRKCTVFYAAISSKTINKEFATDAISALSINKVKRELFPVIAEKEHFDLEQKKYTAIEYIKDLMVVTDSEKDFINRFANKEYRPELLFDDEDIVARIKEHPMALWKMQH